jgi:hypothetical protein
VTPAFGFARRCRYSSQSRGHPAVPAHAWRIMTSPRDDRRSARRIPLGCDALIRPLNQTETYPASCLEISPGGMTLESDYVPRVAEYLDVLVHQPQGGVDRPPLHVRVEVKRCHRTASGKYQLGGQITQVLK